MSKIGLKFWQHFILLGILAVLVIIFIIGNLSPSNENDGTNQQMFGKFELRYENADSVMLLFYPGITISDSIRYEEIRGATSGYVIQVFLVGKECDYVLKIDSRDTDVIPKGNDTLTYTTYYLSEKNISNFTLSLESCVAMNPTTYITDYLEFSDYFVSVMCSMKDSCISISGVATAHAYILNPMFEDDKFLMNGYFRADSIPIGKRTVN